MHKRWLAVLVITLTSGIALGRSATRSDLTQEDLARVRAVTETTTDFSRAEAFEALPAGAATSRAPLGRNSFSFPAANLSLADEERFRLGSALFKKLWSPAPSSTQASDGLGPFFNARGCRNCHIGNGRGRPPIEGEMPTSMFVRLSVPPSTEAERQRLARHEIKTIPEPTYGEQLQSFAIAGLAAEARLALSYSEEPVRFADGTMVSLRRPSYSITDLRYGPLAQGAMLSPRVAPPMIGLGLLETIPAEDILAQVDPDDADGDGISGRANLVRDAATGETRLGRFGWKAGTASIAQQSADAFAGDMGISNPLADRPYGDCTAAQTDCLARPTGVQPRLGSTEAPDPVLGLVTFYAQNLAVPARRTVDAPQVLAGKRAFHGAGCAACHTPKFVTSRDAPDPQHRFQLIWPYSDLLLHDMGEGLADNRPEGVADGREWRTPPLWGLGLTSLVSGHGLLLHDGRARTVTEAILWHGGEAEPARTRFMAMDRATRDALLAFVESL